MQTNCEKDRVRRRKGKGKTVWVWELGDGCTGVLMKEGMVMRPMLPEIQDDADNNKKDASPHKLIKWICMKIPFHSDKLRSEIHAGRLHACAGEETTGSSDSSHQICDMK
jgi:hypothetical protein